MGTANKLHGAGRFGSIGQSQKLLQSPTTPHACRVVLVCLHAFFVTSRLAVECGLCFCLLCFTLAGKLSLGYAQRECFVSQSFVTGSSTRNRLWVVVAVLVLPLAFEYSGNDSRNHGVHNAFTDTLLWYCELCLSCRCSGISPPLVVTRLVGKLCWRLVGVCLNHRRRQRETGCAGSPKPGVTSRKVSAPLFIAVLMLRLGRRFLARSYEKS